METDKDRYFLWRSKVTITKIPSVYIAPMEHKTFLSKVEVIVENLTLEEARALTTLMNAGG